MNRRSISWALTLLVVVSALAMVTSTSVGDAKAFNVGAPVISGKISPDGLFVELVQPGVTSATPLNDGDLIFGDIVDIYVFDTHAHDGTAHVTYAQYEAGNVTQFANATFAISGLNLTEYTLTLPTSINQAAASINVDGAVWNINHLTPFTLLPNGILDIGGLDLVVIATLIEFVAMSAPLTLLARRLVRGRALYAPNFSLLMWGHIFGISLFTAVLLNFQWVDQHLGGVSYFVYPIVLTSMWFLWSLHLFNNAKVIEILKADTLGGHRLRFLRWTQLVGETKDGRVVLVGTRWRDFVYGCLGHFATLIPVETEATIEGRPVGSSVQNRRIIPNHDKKSILRRWRPGKESPTDDFEIINSDKNGEPEKIFWVDSTEPVDVRFPHMVWHKWVDVPRKLDKNGNVIEAHRERKLTWPHIVDPVSNIRLAGIHYVDAPVAALNWGSSEDAFKLLEKRGYQIYILRSRYHSEADKNTEERLAEFLMLEESGTHPLSDDEAREETDRSRMLDRRDRRGLGDLDYERLESERRRREQRP